ncbi:MAG: glycoside hydrolase family 99-like domain-containing protein [bacterium]
MKARTIAFYLPQFHPIPENDEWWGKGFTEWINVTKAKPLFPGHYQPHLPADLGFYDLRVPEVRDAQAELARQYGIHGFCYYHYWFNGRRLLERPVNEILATGKPDFPFCLCWANENWTRRWDGCEDEVLLAQNYCEEDDLNHIRWLSSVFKDARYIQIYGKPIFLVYRLSQLPNPARTVEVWRNECRRLGVGEIFICNVEGAPEQEGLVDRYGLDAAVEFAPDWNARPEPIIASEQGFFEKLLANHPRIHRSLAELGFVVPRRPDQIPLVYDYWSMAEKIMAKKAVSYMRFPCVTPSWDNTARSAAFITHGSTPDKYERWLKLTVDNAIAKEGEKPVIFINAWNEWAEGNHLEPCQKWGRGYLEATRRVLL